MAAGTSTKRLTLFRFLDGTSLEAGLRKSTRESTDNTQKVVVNIEGWRGLLVHGTITSNAKWTKDIETLTGLEVSATQSTPGAALLLLDAQENLWAAIWGTGRHLLDAEQFDYGFGARIVARSALASEVRSLTKTILDHRSRVDRTSTPNGSTVQELGVDGYGEVISRIESRAQLEGLACGNRTVAIRAADSLSLPLAITASDLKSDLEALGSVLDRPVIRGLESLEQLIALKSKDERVRDLNARLVKAIQSGDLERLRIAWPHERLDPWGPYLSVRVTGLGRSTEGVLDQTPDLEDVLAWLRGKPESEILRRLEAIRIELHGEADPTSNTVVSNAVILRRWLSFEILNDTGQRYCLHDGSWYRMDDRYLDRVDSRVREILEDQPEFTFPAWGDEHEDVYNETLATSLGGICMDKKLITTPLHARGGIEPCDVFLSPGTLVHVKRGKRSDDLSHLLAQGLVSTEALARDENARTAWKQRIESLSGRPAGDANLKRVILGIGRRRPITVDSLMSFTKVNLVKQYDALRYLGVSVQVCSIPTT